MKLGRRRAAEHVLKALQQTERNGARNEPELQPLNGSATRWETGLFRRRAPMSHWGPSSADMSRSACMLPGVDANDRYC